MSNKQDSAIARLIVFGLSVIAVLGFLYVAGIVMFFLFAGGGEWG